MVYDSKGRINGILYIDPSSGDFREIISVDYDMRVVKYNYNYSYISHASYGFILNEDGYISQIGRCTLKYDSKGYLVDVDDPYWNSTLSYSDNILNVVSSMKNGNISLYYVTFGNIDNQGDLYIGIQRENYKNGIYLSYDEIACTVAYLSGLFGKVVESVINYNNKDEATSLIKYIDDKYSYSLKLTFISE